MNRDTGQADTLDERVRIIGFIAQNLTVEKDIAGLLDQDPIGENELLKHS